MSEDRSERRRRADAPRELADDDPDMGDLFDELSELESVVDTDEEREQVRETMQTAVEAQQPVVFGRVIWGFDRADLAEAVLGSLLLGLPMFVEGGTLEVGDFLAAHPIFLAFTYAVGIVLVIGILYVSEIQDVRVRDPILGLVPRRLAAVLLVSFIGALAMMTAWGRVDWANEWLAFCQCSVAFVPMAIGAALGDILPGT